MSARLARDAEEMAKLLPSKDPGSKVRALQFFASAGAAVAAEHRSAICACLADGDVVVRGAAASALVAAGDVAAPLLKDLTSLLAEGSGGVKCAAAEVIGALGPSGAPAAADVARLLEDVSEDTDAAMLSAACVISRPKAAMRLPRCAGAEALPKLGTEGQAFAAPVARLLKDGVPEVRAAAAASLGAMGAAGAAHEAEVLALLTSEQEDPSVVAAAATALGEMGKAKGAPSAGSVEAVLELLGSEHPGVRCGAVRGLGALGEQAAPHAGRLLKCLTDRSPQVKVATLSAIAGLGVAGQVYAADVARVAHDDWQLPAVRAAALDALPAMGDRGAAFAEEVAELLGDEEEEVRAAAAHALERMGGEAAEAVGWHAWN